MEVWLMQINWFYESGKGASWIETIVIIIGLNQDKTPVKTFIISSDINVCKPHEEPTWLFNEEILD